MTVYRILVEVSPRIKVVVEIHRFDEMPLRLLVDQYSFHMVEAAVVVEIRTYVEMMVVAAVPVSSYCCVVTS